MAVWLAGPNHIRIKRGSNSRAGGSHSGPHTERQRRTYRSIQAGLSAAWRARFGNRPFPPVKVIS